MSGWKKGDRVRVRADAVSPYRGLVATVYRVKRHRRCARVDLHLFVPGGGIGPQWHEAREVGPPDQTLPLFDALPACRVCGCTDDDCSGCVERTGAPCHWVEPDLCSACQSEGAPA